MTLQAIPGGLEIPPIPTTSGTAPVKLSNTGSTIDASGEKYAYILRAPKTGDIAKVVWGTRTVTTGDTVDVRLESVDAATGFPSGTLLDTNTNASQVVGDGDDNVAFVTALTAAASVTKGDIIAVVIANGSAPGNMQIAAFDRDAHRDFPYAALFTASWGAGGGGLLVALEYSDGSYEPIYGALPPPATDFTNNSFSSSSTPDIYGMRFQVPFPCRVTGAWVWVDGNGDFDLKLVSAAYHQGNGTGILASTSVDKDVLWARIGTVSRFQFPESVELDANTNYRLILIPTTTTAISLYDMPVSSLALLDAFHGGQEWHLTTAKDPTQDSDWTNHNSGTFARPLMGLLIDAFDDAAGGSGSMGVNQGLHGISTGIQA